MSRVVCRTNFRAEIDPRRPGNLGMAHVPDRWFADTPEKVELHYAEECRRIELEVRRHVGGLGNVRTEWDTEAVCSFCGFGWDPAMGPDYNGGCCAEDEANRPAEAAAS